MSGSVKANSSKNKSSSSASGSSTSKPILSEQWLNAFNAGAGNIGSTGYTPDQAMGTNFLRGNLNDNPVRGATAATNNFLGASANNFGYLNSQLAPFINQEARQADYAGDVTAQTGAGMMDAYKNPWQTDVIDASVADYNAGADRALTGMRAGRDAAGAFGDRSAIADAVFQADANRGLGSLTSGLRAQGFNTAAGLGQQDAGRFLQADQGNQMARAQNNQFNVNAGYQGDQQRMGAISDVGRNVLSAAGLNQQQLDNVVTANGIDVNAAQTLFNAGGISQDQLAQIISLAAQANGDQINSSGTQTGTGSSKSKGGSASAQ